MRAREHEFVPIGTQSNELPPQLLAALTKLEKRSGNTPFFTMEFRAGRHGLKFKQFAGIIHLTTNFTLEILPKLENSISTTNDKNALAYMVARSFAAPSVVGTAGKVNEFDSLLELLISITIEEINKQTFAGLTRDFLSISTDLPSLRGQIDFARQIGRYAMRRDRFIQRALTPTYDTAINRVLVRGLEEMKTITQSRLSRSKIASALNIFREAGVGSLRRNDHLAAFHRVNGRWKSSFELCLQWLNHVRPGLTSGIDAVGPSMLFDMNRLFERYVGYCLRTTFGDLVREQRAEKYLFSNDLGRSAGLLRPDFLVYGGKKRIIIETKWKRAQTKLGFQQQPDDLRQAFAYAKVLETSDVVLVYPTLQDYCISEEFRSNTTPSITLTIATIPVLPYHSDGREGFINLINQKLC